jgi:hypothetical protein
MVLTRILLLCVLLGQSPSWFWLPATASSINTTSLRRATDSSSRILPGPPPPLLPRKVPLRRALPPKVIVGYATSCDDKVETAVRQGVNVVIWAFLYLKPLDHQVVVDVESSSSSSSLDVSCIQFMIERLDGLGFKDTVHLVSMGGWNGPHLNPTFPTAASWWEAWMTLGYGTVFHGIDIDFEGNTNLTSPTNYFSVELFRTNSSIGL